MGSDFNNQDLLETDSIINEYTHRIVSREGEGDQSVITIESTPTPTATVTWKKLVQRIRADGLPLEMEYRCEKRPNRRMVFDEFKIMDGRMIPTRWTMTPQDTEGKRTVITRITSYNVCYTKLLRAHRHRSRLQLVPGHHPRLPCLNGRNLRPA